LFNDFVKKMYNSFKIILTAVLTFLFVASLIVFASNSLHFIFGLIFFVYLVLCFVRPFWGLLTYVFLSLHTQLVGQQLGGLAIYNILLFVIGSSYFIRYFREIYSKKNMAVLKNSFTLTIGLIISILLVSIFNGTTKYSSVVFFCLRIFVVIFIIGYSMRSERDLKVVLNTLILSGLCIILFGFFEIAIGRTVFYSAWTMAERYRMGIIRMGSTLGDPNYICFTIIPIIPIAHYFFLISNTKKLRMYYVLSILVFSLGVLLSFSRIGYIVLVLYFFFYGYWKLIKKLNIVLKFTISFMIIALLSLGFLRGVSYISEKFEARSSTDTRVKAFKTSLDNYFVHPIIGVGFERLEEMNAFHVKTKLTKTGGISAMNTFLKILAENGPFVLLFFVFIIIRAYLRCRSYSRKIELFNYLIISLLLWCFIALTLDSLGTPLFWLLIGVIFFNDHYLKSPKDIT